MLLDELRKVQAPEHELYQSWFKEENRQVWQPWLLWITVCVGSETLCSRIKISTASSTKSISRDGLRAAVYLLL